MSKMAGSLSLFLRVELGDIGLIGGEVFSGDVGDPVVFEFPFILVRKKSKSWSSFPATSAECSRLTTLFLSKEVLHIR
jgi:hypothetical protein